MTEALSAAAEMGLFWTMTTGHVPTLTNAWRVCAVKYVSTCPGDSAVNVRVAIPWSKTGHLVKVELDAEHCIPTNLLTWCWFQMLMSVLSPTVVVPTTATTLWEVTSARAEMGMNWEETTKLVWT